MQLGTLPITPESLEEDNVPETRKPLRSAGVKVKTGCRTCRKRHVKCDETRPSCLRCLKYKGVCEGYNTPVDRLAQAARPLIPKTNSDSSSSSSSTRTSPFSIASSSSSDSSVQSVSNDPRRALFSSDREYRSFLFFCDQTAIRLAGPNRNSTMWSKLVLQACEDEPILRHAVISIGALDLALEAQARSRKHNAFFNTIADGDDIDSPRAFAIQQYSKAVSQLRKFIAKKDTNMRVVIVACLLFVCFESFHGNNQASMKHTQSGIRLLGEWMPKRAGQDRVHESYLSGIRSPAPYDLEDEFIEAFIRLDISALTFANQTEELNEPKVTPGIEEVCRWMPNRFETVDEAKRYWLIVWRDTIIYVRFTHPSPLYKHGIKLCAPSMPFQHILAGPQTKEEDRKLALMGLLRWSAAFRPVFEHSRTPEGRRDFVLASTIELQFRACYISVCGIYEDEMYYDGQTSHFKEMLSLAEELQMHSINNESNITASSARANFIFDGPVIGSIYTIALHCREPKLRRRAIRWLNERPKREGIWDSQLSATVATIVMEIEEKGMIDGHVPLHARLRDVQTKFSLLERRGLLQYRRFSAEEGKYKVKEMVFGW